jgi:large conductance mechanosensitive channel
MQPQPDRAVHRGSRPVLERRVLPPLSAGSVFANLPGDGICRACDKSRRGSMLKEFQEFIAKGNVMDLAVGVIIGGAFGLIVNSLVGDIIMPIIGAIFGGFDFSNYFLPLSSEVTATSLDAAKEQGAVFAYGNFITVVINFLILAWIIFLMVKAVNNLRRRLEREKQVAAVPPAPPADVQLLTEIRDLLAKR